MAGTALSTLANYQDSDVTHEHTYFGNNQPERNSTTVGTDYQTTTYDGETQKIGTYYNFQAATIGTGASLTEQYDEAPNSFCPAGWQLPIDDNQIGNKSFRSILNDYGVSNNGAGSIILRSYALSYVFSGNYGWNEGSLYPMNDYGHWWSNTISDDKNAYYLSISNSYVQNPRSNNKNYGLALRCVSTYWYILEQIHTSVTTKEYKLGQTALSVSLE